MNAHLKTSLAAIAFVVAGAAHASDASQFEIPTGSQASRASVQADARRALAAGMLNYNDASGRIEAPMADTRVERQSLRRDRAVTMAPQGRTFGDRSLSSLYYVGGM